MCPRVAFAPSAVAPIRTRDHPVSRHSHVSAQLPRHAHTGHPPTSKKSRRRRCGSSRGTIAATSSAPLHSRMPHRALHACAHFPGRCPGPSHPAPLGQSPPRYPHTPYAAHPSSPSPTADCTILHYTTQKLWNSQTQKDEVPKSQGSSEKRPAQRKPRKSLRLAGASP